MKYIVTHHSPDLDAVTSCWIIKRFFSGWKNAQIKFVPAGATLNNQPVDTNSNIIHVDTGLGKFDHHQNNEFTCASKKVFEYLLEKKFLKNELSKKALLIIIDFVNQVDHFYEVKFPNPTSDIYDFCLHQIIEGLKASTSDEIEIINCGLKMLDGVFQILKNKIKGYEEIKKGYIFQTKWGKAIALETKNEESIKLALKIGYCLVIRKDPIKKIVRIKAHPKNNIDLTPIYQKIIQIDKKGTWFLHSSKKMLLNGSSKNPNLKPTPLSLIKIIEIIKKL